MERNTIYIYSLLEFKPFFYFFTHTHITLSVYYTTRIHFIQLLQSHTQHFNSTQLNSYTHTYINNFLPLPAPQSKAMQ